MELWGHCLDVGCASLESSRAHRVRPRRLVYTNGSHNNLCTQRPLMRVFFLPGMSLGVCSNDLQGPNSNFVTGLLRLRPLARPLCLAVARPRYEARVARQRVQSGVGGFAHGSIRNDVHRARHDDIMKNHYSERKKTVRRKKIPRGQTLLNVFYASAHFL